MLSNAHFLAKFCFATAENEPAKNLQNFANFPNFANPNGACSGRAPDDSRDVRGGGRRRAAVGPRRLLRRRGRRGRPLRLAGGGPGPGQGK